MHRKNPCYPVCTGPGREEGCHATCPEWAKHEFIKFVDYAIKNKQQTLNQDINEHIKASMGRRRRKRKVE